MFCFYCWEPISDQAPRADPTDDGNDPLRLAWAQHGQVMRLPGGPTIPLDTFVPIEATVDVHVRCWRAHRNRSDNRLALSPMVTADIGPE